MDCLAGGKALHWGECKHLNPSSCGCEDEDKPVCGKDFKTYKNQCVSGCMNVKTQHYGSCGSIGFAKHKSPMNMMKQINDDFTYNGLWLNNYI